MKNDKKIKILFSLVVIALIIEIMIGFILWGVWYTADHNYQDSSQINLKTFNRLHNLEKKLNLEYNEKTGEYSHFVSE